MDFGKTGGMSTATVAAKGTEGACNKQDGREHEEGLEDGNMRGQLKRGHGRMDTKVPLFVRRNKGTGFALSY